MSYQTVREIFWDHFADCLICKQCTVPLSEEKHTLDHVLGSLLFTMQTFRYFVRSCSCFGL